MAIITRRSSSTNKTITFDGYTGDLVPEISDGVGKAPNPTALSVAGAYLVATHIGNYALFGGATDGNPSAVVDAYDTSLNRTTPTALSVVRAGLAATHIGNYALFGGGAGGGSNSAVVDAYDTSLNRTTPTALSVARTNLAATHVGNYALFGGGSSLSAVVDAYDTSLNRTTPTALSAARYTLAATHIGDYALFGGGQDNDTSGDRSNYSKAVDAYDTSLNRTAPTPLSVARHALAATHVGNYALFGGGADYATSDDGSDYSKAVDAYTTKVYKATITLPPNVSYEFDGVSGTTTEPTDVVVGYPVYGSVTV